MPPIVLGGIYLGVFTASEAAAIGCIYALAVGAGIYRNFGLRDLWETACETVRTSAMLFMILAAAAMFGHAVTIIRLPAELVETVIALDVSAITFVLAVMAVVFLMGMFLETISIIQITTPIVFPVLMQLGVDPIWYGILLMINLELALITPPVGMNLFVIKGITDAPPQGRDHGNATLCGAHDARPDCGAAGTAACHLAAASRGIWMVAKCWPNGTHPSSAWRCLSSN